MADNNFDYEAEREAIDQKQAIAQALIQGTLAPIHLPQQPGVKVSPLTVLQKMVEGYVAGKMMSQGKEDRIALAGQMNDRLQTGLQAYSNNLQAGDKQKAIFEAMASNHPLLQAMAAKQMEKMGEGQLTPQDLAKMATPESVLANPSNPAGWAAKRDLKAVAPGEVLLDEGGNVTQPGNKTGNPAYNVKNIGGDLYQETSTGLKKLDNAPHTTVSVNASPVVMGQRAGMQEYFKNAAGQVDALGKVAQNAGNIKQTLAEMQNLDNQGIFSNATTGPATFLNNLGQAAGVKVDATKLGNTEAYNAMTNDLWQGLVGKFGGNRGVTSQEAAEIKKMVPLASSSPQARQQLYGILNNIADRQIQQYQSANKAFAESALQEDPTIFSKGFGDVYTPQPQQPQPVTPAAGQAGQPIPFDQYLKSIGGH